MGWLQRTARFMGAVARELLQENRRQARTQARRTRPPAGRRREPIGTPVSAAGKIVEFNGPLPALEYVPKKDGSADPGEVVWAWVPYEDDPNQGKDRPILILATVPGGYLSVQLTTRDRAHTNSLTVDNYGRIWQDIGSGAWDSQGRDSEARLDRLLFAPKAAIRREGSALAKDKYLLVAEALHQIYVK